MVMAALHVAAFVAMVTITMIVAVTMPVAAMTVMAVVDMHADPARADTDSHALCLCDRSHRANA